MVGAVDGGLDVERWGDMHLGGKHRRRQHAVLVWRFGPLKGGMCDASGRVRVAPI